MSSDQTQEVLDQLAAIRGRLDRLCAGWNAGGDTANVIRGLKSLADDSAAYPSIQALLFGASELIEHGEAAGHRLEKLSDHLHGYMVGWEDAAQAGGP